MTTISRPLREVQPIKDRDGLITAYVVSTLPQNGRKGRIAVVYARSPHFWRIDAAYHEAKAAEVGS